MSTPNPISAENHSQAPIPAASTGAANAAQAEGAMSMNAPAEAAGVATKFSNMGDLQRKNPKLYHQMMLGLATFMISDMRDHQERLKKLRQEGRQDA